MKNGALGTSLRSCVPVFGGCSDSKQKQALKEGSEKYQSFRERFKMQRVFAKIATDPKFKTSEEMKAIRIDGKIPRICHCLKTPRAQLVPIHLSDGKKVGNFRSLQSCGSAYGCPICASKISEYRSKEVNAACKKWLGESPENSMLMIAFTIPHYIFQDLKSVRTKFMRARRELKRQKKLKRKPGLTVFSELRAEYGMVHDITAADFTWSGKNGWHVHSHDLYFCRRLISDDERSELEKKLVKAWIYACKKKCVGIRIDANTERFMLSHAVRVQIAKTPADYLAKFGDAVFEKNRDLFENKWGAAQELTKSHIKHGHRGGLTPWDFARAIMKIQNDDVYFFFGRLINEFVSVMKGKQMLFWSKGSRAYFELWEVSDEQAAAIAESGEQFIYAMDLEEWKAVKANHKRAEVLIRAGECHDWRKINPLRDFIRGLMECANSKRLLKAV